MGSAEMCVHATMHEYGMHTLLKVRREGEGNQVGLANMDVDNGWQAPRATDGNINRKHSIRMKTKVAPSVLHSGGNTESGFKMLQSTAHAQKYLPPPACPKTGRVQEKTGCQSLEKPVLPRSTRVARTCARLRRLWPITGTHP